MPPSVQSEDEPPFPPTPHSCSPEIWPIQNEERTGVAWESTLVAKRAVVRRMVECILKGGMFFMGG